MWYYYDPDEIVIMLNNVLLIREIKWHDAPLSIFHTYSAYFFNHFILSTVVKTTKLQALLRVKEKEWTVWSKIVRKIAVSCLL